MANPDLIYPRSFDHQMVYLKNVITDPNVTVGDYTIYHDPVTKGKLHIQSVYPPAGRQAFFA